MERLELGGHSLLVPENAAGELWWGAFVMAPWTSTLRNARFEFDGRLLRVPADHPPHAEHGTVRKAAWERRDGNVLATPIADGWPLGGEVTLSPVLTPGCLQLRLTVRALDHPMPAAVGWHPWFVRELDGVEVDVRIPDGALVQDRDDAGRPTGRWAAAPAGPWNDCLRSDGPASLVWPGVGTLEVSWSGDFVTVFSGHPQGVCVEPVSGPAEAMDRILRPSEELSMTISLRWQGAA
ncbi:aldose epimerase family protein [Kribbella swartbergensis]